MGICKLCTENKELIKKSHIYPNFVYTDLFDKHGKLRKFEVDEMKKLNPKVSKPASGAYEGNLLCNDCDNKRISKLESYVAGLINGQDKNLKCKAGATEDGLETIEIENLKYDYLKNFILSILFRANISSFTEFNDVNLGPYNDKIREIIYNNLISDDLEYQVNIFKLCKDSNYNTLIGQPVRSKIKSETIFSILMKGYLIIISLKQNEISKKIKNIRLKSTGTLAIPIIPKVLEEKILFKYFGLT